MSLFCDFNEENIIYEHIDGHDDWATAPPKTTLGSVGYPSRNGNIGLKWGGWGDNVIAPPSGSVFTVRSYTHKNNTSSMPKKRAYNLNYKRLTNALHSHEFSLRRMKYVKCKTYVGFHYMMCCDYSSPLRKL